MFYLDLCRELQKHEVQYVVVGDDLIALKTDTGRGKDASDIVALRKVQQIAIECK